MIFEMHCPNCDNYGETSSEETAENLVGLHNDHQHGGEAVAFVEESYESEEAAKA